MSKTTMDLVQEAKASINEVTIEQAKTMFSEGSIALDVRESLEYETGHIPNAKHISRGMLEFMIGNHPDFQNKNASVVVYCKSGGRSALATATCNILVTLTSILCSVASMPGAKVAIFHQKHTLSFKHIHPHN